LQRRVSQNIALLSTCEKGEKTAVSDWNSQVIEEFRRHGGKVGGFYEGAPLLLLTTRGRRSGKPCTTPLGYQVEGTRLIVIAANIGATKHPDWYYNLVAHPQVTVEIGQETFSAIATIMEGEERESFLARGREAWAQERSRWPELELDDVPAETTRRIPVIALQRL
jgi:deazaflavin-dependent oxidoreductase (nitroreductase family)